MESDSELILKEFENEDHFIVLTAVVNCNNEILGWKTMAFVDQINCIYCFIEGFKNGRKPYNRERGLPSREFINSYLGYN